MIDHLDIKLKLFLLTSPFIIGFISLTMDLRIACSKEYDVMIAALQRSACLEFITTLWGEQSIRARLLVISMVGGLIAFPTYHIRKGALDPLDYQNFPASLKKKINTASWLNTIAFTWLTVGYFFLLPR
ncbi:MULTISPECIES: hypothetical protein [unclassified Pseudomonas]|uniref:hypothetical protein n=1 Tax=unclassified Pseudomonas TaxID=196821 RepID=UPI000B4FE646|nr:MULTISPECIES: hypothetical protein [unclassified Pseudomonas]TFA88734.1 hypothetical protein F473_02631 [Pseudomonas sp. URIL14HWK12:I1]SNB75569.1 hypothetical protein SAMN02746026_02706 [Pseudomonas sp. LAIL14HWK12:I4]